MFSLINLFTSSFISSVPASEYIEVLIVVPSKIGSDIVVDEFKSVFVFN